MARVEEKVERNVLNSSHLSACSASLALCTSSSFSVMSVPERWKLKVVPRLLSVTGPTSEAGGRLGKGGKHVKSETGKGCRGGLGNW